MSALADEVLQARAARDAAKATWEARLAQVRADVDARGVGGRIADRVSEQAVETLDQAIDIAAQNRGVIAGTVVALALLILRHPIIGWIDALLGPEQTPEQTVEQED